MTASSKDNIRLLVVSTFCDRPERELFCRLASEISVSMLCDPADPGIDELRRSGVKILPYALPSNSRSEQLNILQNIIRDDITVVYAPRTETLSLSITALKGTDTRLVGYRGTTGHLSIVDIAPRLTYKNPRVDTIVCVSEAVRKYLMSKGVSGKKLTTVPKGHDIKWYAPAERSVLKEFGIPDDAFVIGFAGRARRIKGVGYLIKAISMMNPDLHAHLLLTGDIDDFIVKAMLQNPSISKRVHCPGFRKDAASLMGACDSFVMPSLKREGLPRALVEVMSQGVPPVASNVGGIPELIEDGISGILVPTRNARAIAAALTSLATDKEKARLIASNAQKRIRDHFNISDTVKRMLAVFQG